MDGITQLLIATHLVESVIGNKYVNGILNHLFLNNTVLFEVEWYGQTQTTWEPLINVKHLKILHQYLLTNDLLKPL